VKRVSPDVVIAGGLLFTLAALTIGAALTASPAKKKDPPLSSLSYQPDGAKGLMLWLQSLGFQVEPGAQEEYLLSSELDLVLLLQPTTAFTLEEQYELTDWVYSGGHLLVVGDSFTVDQILSEFDLKLVPLPEKAEWLFLQSPLLQSPPVEKPVHANAEYGILGGRFETQVHLAVEDTPAAVIFQAGAGTVTAATSLFPFSNAGVQEEGNSQFVYNLITYPGDNRVVWFDEWHHGVRKQVLDRLGPIYWLFDSAPGHGILFALGVIWVGLLLAGRKFGRPMLFSEGPRLRAPVEYAQAIARLRRRAGHRPTATAHFRHSLKKRLGARYQLDPAQEDERFVDALKRYRPNLDAPRLKKLLGRLSGKKISERELVNLAGEVSDWIDREK
jgi:hypothetical protein